MAYVILRSGKVLEYKDVTSINTEGNMVVLCGAEDDGKNYLIAKFPCDVVERVEYNRPVRIMKEKAIRAIKKIYKL